MYMYIYVCIYINIGYLQDKCVCVYMPAWTFERWMCVHVCTCVCTHAWVRDVSSRSNQNIPDVHEGMIQPKFGEQITSNWTLFANYDRSLCRQNKNQINSPNGRLMQQKSKKLKSSTHVHTSAKYFIKKQNNFSSSKTFQFSVEIHT